MKLRIMEKSQRQRVGWEVAALGSPLRITQGNMDEDLYHEELFFSHTLELSKVVQEATKTPSRSWPYPLGMWFHLQGPRDDCSAIQA